ncbi:AAA family ATPase [Acidovorax sp. FG27]|uniref:AAA family ATPase n=1 Tax=Acidovorax sp. FG27 TaxID=3133652 RepID=UPI0030E7F106
MSLAPLHARLGLARSPFPPTPDASAYFFTPALQEQFAEVVHCIQARKGFVLLTGEVGLGKSTFVRRLLDTLPEDAVRSALVFNTFLQREALLSAVLRDFGLEPSSDIDEALTRLNGFLLDEHRAGRTCLLVIDDAQNLQPASLELVRLLCNLETGQEKLLQIVLAGQPELEALLGGQDLRQLQSRIVKHVRLAGLQADQVLRYFEMRVSAASASGRIALQPRAARALHRATGGNLRRIHLVLDRCMYGLAAQGGGTIDTQLLRSALDDLETGPPARRSRTGWYAMLAASGLGMAALGVGASYVWPTDSPAPVAQPAGPAAPAATAKAVEAPGPSAAPAAAAPAPAATASAPAAQAVAGPDEPACLARVAAEAQGRPLASRALPARAAGLLQPSAALCLFDRGGERWAFWRDTLDKSAYAVTPRATPASTALQRLLVRQGALDAAQVDGFYGPQTVAALATFQGRLGLPATPVPDELTYMLLENMNAAPASAARSE